MTTTPTPTRRRRSPVNNARAAAAPRRSCRGGGLSSGSWPRRRGKRWGPWHGLGRRRSTRNCGRRWRRPSTRHATPRLRSSHMAGKLRHRRAPSVDGNKDEDEGRETRGVPGGAPVREARELVAELCRHFYAQGWVTGTGGSITVKVNDPAVPLADRLIVMSPYGRSNPGLDLASNATPAPGEQTTFRFYRGAQGRLCSFSCTNTTIKKFQGCTCKAQAKQMQPWPNQGLEESELLALAENKELQFTYTKEPELIPRGDTSGEVIAPELAKLLAATKPLVKLGS